MKDTILHVLFFLLILILALVSLSLLRIAVFLIDSYDAVYGIKFSAVTLNIFRFLKDILPFAVIVSILILFIRMYKHPGILWLSYLIIFGLSLTVWLIGFRVIDANRAHENIPIGLTAQNTGILSPGNIYSLEEYELYVHDLQANRVEKAVLAGRGLNKNYLQYYSDVSASELLMQFDQLDERKNPVHATSIRESAFFTSTLNDLHLFKEYLYDTYSSGRTTFYILSIVTITLFICSSILLKISKLPLFILALMIIFLRLYFYAFAGFTAGIPGVIIRPLLPDTISPQLVFTGYMTILFLFITIRYHLIHRPVASGEPE